MADQTLSVHPDVLTLWDAFELEPDPRAKQDLALQLAETYAEHHDDMSLETPRQVHEMVQVLERAGMAYHQGAISLGLTVIKLLRECRLTPTQKDSAN